MFQRQLLFVVLAAALACGCGQNNPKPKAKAKGGGLSKLLQPPSDYSNIDEDDSDAGADGEMDEDDGDAGGPALVRTPRTPLTVAESDAFDHHARHWLMQAPDEQLLLVRALERFSRQSLKEADLTAGPWREKFTGWKAEVEKLLIDREMEDWVFTIRSYGYDRDKMVANKAPLTLIDAGLGSSLDAIKGSTERFNRHAPFIKLTGEGANDDLTAFAQPGYQRSYLRVWGKIKKATISDGIAMQRGGLHFPIELEIELKKVRHLKGDETSTRIAW